jgi:hypothetical protein
MLIPDRFPNEKQEYSDQEFYEEFVKDSQKPLQLRLLSQRIPDKELIARVAREIRYPKHEVQDVLKGLWDVINVQLEQGREINFGGLFIARLYKPFPRRLYDWKKEHFRITDPRPKLKLVSTDAYQKYLWKAIHAPINYFPPEKVRNQDMNRQQFTTVLADATEKFEAVERERKTSAKIVGEEVPDPL